MPKYRFPRVRRSREQKQDVELVGLAMVCAQRYQQYPDCLERENIRVQLVELIDEMTSDDKKTIREHLRKKYGLYITTLRKGKR